MTDQSSDATRARLLDSARAVFAERGYHSASIRDICRLAQANGAAIHYHFGDKAALYRQVYARSFERIGLCIEALTRSDTLEALEGYFQALLQPLVSGDSSLQTARLHAREEFEPTGLLEALREECIRPAHKGLSNFVGRYLALPGEDLAVQRLTFAIAGMGTFYLHGRAVVDMLQTGVLEGEGWFEDLTSQLAHQAHDLLKAALARKEQA